MKLRQSLSALLLAALMTISLAVPCLAQDEIKISLDGKALPLSNNLPEIKDGRTMIPIRALAEALGADVEWVQAEQKVVMTRAGTVVTMTVGDQTAYVDGTPLAMDVVPYLSGERTLIPARYLAEFFGQVMNWDNDSRTVLVTEDKSVVGDSNLETWALPMGAMRPQMDGLVTVVFGQYPRGQAYSGPKPMAVNMRSRLSSDWSIENRADLIDAVLSMTVAGHNDKFLYDVEMINSLTAAQYQQILDSATGMDAYMFPQTKALGQKWGDKGILAWDLFRMSNLVQWGYTAGYVTYPEALALLEPAVNLLQQTFTSWEEAYENYLDGYNWWSRSDMTGKELWTSGRGPVCRRMLDASPELFDDALFTQDIIPVPNLTAQQIWDETFPAAGATQTKPAP